MCGVWQHLVHRELRQLVRVTLSAQTPPSRHWPNLATHPLPPYGVLALSHDLACLCSNLTLLHMLFLAILADCGRHQGVRFVALKHAGSSLVMFGNPSNAPYGVLAFHVIWSLLAGRWSLC
jgi:hypothetical protein